MPLNEEDEQKAGFSNTFVYTVQLNGFQKAAGRCSRSWLLSLQNFEVWSSQSQEVLRAALRARTRKSPSSNANTKRGTAGGRHSEARRFSRPSSAKEPRLDRLEAHPLRGCSAGRRRREPALPHAAPGELPAPQPARRH